MARQTIANSVFLAGTGLHTGTRATLTCLPAEPGSGVRFRRVDLPGTPVVPARVDEVEITERRTAIGHGNNTIHTVEHVLAAVGSLAIDDIILELDGPEPPIMDGSFEPFVALLESAGILEHGGDPALFEVRAPFTVVEGDARYVVAPNPGQGLRCTTTIEWDHPLIGRQTGSWDLTPETFRREIAAARTFGFASEVDELQAQGLLQGASTENAVALSDTGVVGTELRWPDEFLRHKTGDILGDLALVGGRIQAHVIAHRPSHRGNVALARAILRMATSRGPVLDIERILEVIPHRYPMLLVDRIVEIEGDHRIVGIKNVTINEPFFQGHFPGHPIMPGVLIIEAMAQVGGFLLLGTIERPESKVVYFMSLDNVKFRRPVIPGDQLRCEVVMVQHRGRTFRMRGTAWVDGRLVAEADMMARVVDR
jgi:UDP-3-O-[3-hydroxymyristoyl] N-acetylglucosamine deacetylase/3-hydroxyacyl-[acyl-carrier-protein] dehydratase